ncbi:hypothetical protein [Novacetimonas hansenii]|uniref:hypothetical protein n=1 Tax=Novacetimonas hansenii TaxID=436 RepID=UPI0030CACB64
MQRRVGKRFAKDCLHSRGVLLHTVQTAPDILSDWGLTSTGFIICEKIAIPTGIKPKILFYILEMFFPKSHHPNRTPTVFGHVCFKIAGTNDLSETLLEKSASIIS